MTVLTIKERRNQQSLRYYHDNKQRIRLLRLKNKQLYDICKCGNRKMTLSKVCRACFQR